MPHELPDVVRIGKAALTTSLQPVEDYTIVHTAPRGKVKKLVARDDGEPLVDTTEVLAKTSKKLARSLKKQQIKQDRESRRVRNFLELPPELLCEVFSHLLPSDVTRVSLLNHATRDFITENQTSIAKDIMDRRFWVLRQSLPLPVLLEDVPEDTRPAILNPQWQARTAINKRPYTHIQPLDAQQICSCLSCIQAWNNLNVVLDFAHFQWHLNNHEPIPMIPRGAMPEWNLELTGAHACIVQRAMTSPLCYAAILEIHLNSVTGTLLRQVRFPPKVPVHRHNKPAASALAKTVHPILYRVTEVDAAAEDDSFLERDGRHSFEMPFNRDNYYSLLAYVPNRKWSKEGQRWLYYAVGAHVRDMAWVKDRFMLRTQSETAFEQHKLTLAETVIKHDKAEPVTTFVRFENTPRAALV